MKFLFRLTNKLVMTVPFLIWIGALLTCSRINIIYDWAYESSERDRRITWELHKEFRGYIKQWFSRV